MKKQHLLLAVAILLLLVAGVYFGRPNPDRATEASEIRIGFLAPLSGDLAPFSNEILKGVQVAIQNKRSSYSGNILLFTEDSNGEAKTAITAFQKLHASNRIQYLIGDLLSSTTLAIVPLLEEANVALISPTAADPNITAGSTLAFSIYPASRQESSFLANAIAQRGSKKIGIIHEQGTTAKDMALTAQDLLKQIGLDVVYVHQLPSNQIDYASFIQGLPSVDSVFLSAFPDQVIPLIRISAERRYHTTWFLPSTMYSDGAVAQFKEISSKIFVSAPRFDATGDASGVLSTFLADYTAQFGSKPTVWAALGFDAASLILNANTIAPEAFKEKLLKNTFQGATGKIRFGDNGQAEKDLTLLEVSDGKFTK